MSFWDVTYKKEERVAVVSLGAPPKDQDQMARLVDSLSDLCTEITLDKEIRVMVLAGSRDDAFSMGEDLLRAIHENYAEAPVGYWRLAEPVADLACPTIAAIHGKVIGPGLELALACDIRFASGDTCFGLPHIKKGLIPWDGGTQRLLREVGKAKAMEMILTGETIDAREAHRIGLVNSLLSPDELSSVVLDVAREIGSKGPISLAYAKEAINKGMDMTLEQGLRLEADLYFLIHTTGDRTEGIEAFQEKRKPGFQGK